MKKPSKSRSISSVGNYLEEINVFRPLSHETEMALAKDIRRGNADALDRLVQANLKFVVSIAKSYQGQGLALSDLISEGNVGLIKAARRFDETRGTKFISYAVWWVRQAILQALTEQARIVRLPLNRLTKLQQISHTTDALQKKLGREPSMNELAGAMKLNEKQLAEFIQHQVREVSLDQTSGGAENDSLLNFVSSQEFVSGEEALSEESLQRDINDLLAKLDARTAEIMRRYFGLNGHRPHSLEMLGHHFKLTRERVRQIKKSALQKLQRSSHALALQEYL